MASRMGDLPMVRLDRDRRPVLFTVVTSVLSGLILTGLTKVLQTGVSAGTTVAEFALASSGVAAVCWAVVATVHRIRNRSSRAFLVISAFNQKYYAAAMVQ